MSRTPDEDSPTVVYTGGTIDAELARSTLESAGIFARLSNDTIGTLEGEFGSGFSPMIGSVQVLVRAKDAEAARRLLKSFRE